MRRLLRVTPLLITTIVLVAASLTSIHAHPTMSEPTPTVDGSAMQRLVAPLAGDPYAPPLDDGAEIAASSGTYTAVYATDVQQGSPSTNYATQTGIFVGQYNGVMRGLLLFDLSALPPNVTINSATLQVYLIESYDYPSTSRTVTAYRVSSSWTEHLVTWNNAPTCAEAYGSTSVGHGTWGWYSLDVTSLAQAWLNGTYANYGLMLRGSENIAYRKFASDATSYAPRLVVNYTLPEQALEAAPESLLFVIGGTSGVTPTQTLHWDTHSLTIDSTTVDVLNWSATKVGGASWLNLDKTSGLFSAAEPDVIGVSVVTDTLAERGIYAEQIQVSTSPAIPGSPSTIDVTFRYTDGMRLSFLPLALRNRAFSSHDYHTGALFMGIADYIYLPASSSALSDPRQPPKTTDLGLASADANSLSGMSIGKGSECGCCGTGGASHGQAGPVATSCCGGGFRENNTILLTEWRATKIAIREAFRWLDQWENENTLVLITFSGHGGYMEDATPIDEADGYDEYIVGAESDGTSEMAGVITDDELAEWLDELESNYIVLIIDSCFSGGMISSQAFSPAQRVRTVMPQMHERKGNGLLMAGDGLVKDISGPGRIVIAASSEDQGSWEFGALEGGALSYYLTEALLDPATDTSGDGWISFEEAFNYASPRVDDYVFSQTGYHQNPQMSDGISGDVKWARP